jgi:hypothetical protein
MVVPPYLFADLVRAVSAREWVVSARWLVDPLISPAAALTARTTAFGVA